MYKTFKTRVAAFSAQHLALAFTMVMSLFFNMGLIAQTEVHLNAFIRRTRDVDNPTNYVRCNIGTPTNAVTKSYAFKVKVINSGDPCSNINVDFGDGQGSREISTTGETTVFVNYPDFGSVPVIVALPNAGDHNATWNGTFTRFRNRAIESGNYQSPDETIPVSGINMHIKYAPSNTQHKLKKPLIFVEGIDFEKGVVYDFTGKPVRVGGFGWDTFVAGMVNDPKSSDNETFALLPDFVNQMLAEGYDIVFCDFQDGTDYIETNGQGLIEVINEVNRRKKAGLSSKQTCYANSIIGASMGGQVVRWALKTMENANTDHDCALYFSMDSPHKGANIPLALQTFIWFNATHGEESAAKDFAKKLWEGITSPAAKQLLAFNLGANGEHNTYISAINQLGYPQKTRNIASANGSSTGQNQGYGNSGLLAYAKGTKSKWGLQIKAFELTLNSSGANEIANFVRVLEEPTWNNDVSILFGGVSLVRQGNSSVLLRSQVTRHPLTTPFSFTTPTSSRTINFGKDMTMWDNAPGGNRGDLGGFFPDIVQTLNDKGLEVTSQGPSGKQCFIPTVSALDLATNDLHTNAAAFVQDVNNPINTPFKHVFVSSTNEPHVFMSSALLTFARDEIVANTKISCGGLMTIDPNIEKEMAPGVGVNPGVNPGVGRTGGMKVIGAEPIGTGLQTREGVAIPVKDDGDNKDN
jgi:hypothetical protein